VRFVDTRTYERQASLGLALGAVPGVLLAAYVFWTLPIGAVRWLVVFVVLYTSVQMLATAKDGSRA
jgi:uncharacterized membrane protein YfcA